MDYIIRLKDFNNGSKLYEYRAKTGDPNEYTIFKVTFANGETHYGEKKGIYTPEIYLSSLKKIGRASCRERVLRLV